MNVDPGRQVRAAAAIRLVANGELSPSTALALTVWPPSDVEQASAVPDRAHFTAEQRAHAIELVVRGLSWAQAAKQTGASKASVGEWVRRAQARNGHLDAAARAR